MLSTPKQRKPLTPAQKARKRELDRIRNTPEYRALRAAQTRERRKDPDVLARDHAAALRWRNKKKEYLKDTDHNRKIVPDEGSLIANADLNQDIIKGTALARTNLIERAASIWQADHGRMFVRHVVARKHTKMGSSSIIVIAKATSAVGFVATAIGRLA